MIRHWCQFKLSMESLTQSQLVNLHISGSLWMAWIWAPKNMEAVSILTLGPDQESTLIFILSSSWSNVKRCIRCDFSWWSNIGCNRFGICWMSHFKSIENSSILFSTITKPFDCRKINFDPIFWKYSENKETNSKINDRFRIQLEYYSSIARYTL